MAVTFGTGLPAEGILYIDGEPAGAFRQRRMDARALEHCAGCFFGTGVFSPMPLGASFTDIRIYGRVLEKEEISSLFHITPEERLRLEAENLEPLFKEPLEKPLSLPGAGQLGVNISWKSLTPDVLSDEGECRRPAAGTGSLTGTLEATLTFQGHVLKAGFRCLIPPLPEDSEIAGQDAAQVSLPFPGHVAGDMPLPASGSSGSVFHWASSRPDIMDDGGHMIGKPYAAPAELVLTLTSEYGKARVTREFPIRILPDRCHPLPRREYITAAFPGREIPQIQASPVPMEDISLNPDSIFYDNQQRCLSYLLLLDADRMLYNFRRAYGAPTGKTMPPGGWEEPSGLLRGHSTGHYLSALAHAYASTKDARYRRKAEYIVGELHAMQELAQGEPAAFRTDCTPSNAVQSLWSRTPGNWGKGFLSAYSPDQFALLEEYTPYATIWAPYYTLHKILAGLIDCYQLLGSQDALSCACGIGGWVFARLSATSGEQRAKMWNMYIAGEYGGMNESLSRLYEITKNGDYLEAAQMFDNPGLFQGLAHGRDTISGIHANQHIPQIIGSLEEFRATSDPAYYHLVRNFWELVVNRYMYSIGGVGRGENFREPGILAGNIEDGRNCETCATYNMLKLTGLLYRYAPDHSPYMDYYERALVNHIAASQNPVTRKSAHHGVTYMLPIGPGARKEYGNDYDDFTCCHGTGMENHVRYTEHIYHRGPDGTLYVNLFMPSEYRWREKGLRLTMDSPFPSQSCRLKIAFENADAPKDAAAALRLKIRIPYWCRDTFRLLLNDKPLPPPEAGAGYYLLERDFSDGDRIAILTPYSLHLCYTEDLYQGYPAGQPDVRAVGDDRAERADGLDPPQPPPGA